LVGVAGWVGRVAGVEDWVVALEEGWVGALQVVAMVEALWAEVVKGRAGTALEVG
jgi:hypothetical protein